MRGCTKLNRQLANCIVLACNSGKGNVIDLIDVHLYEAFKIIPLKRYLNQIIWRLGKSAKHIRNWLRGERENNRE